MAKQLFTPLDQNPAWSDKAPDTSGHTRIAMSQVWSPGFGRWLEDEQRHTVRPGESVAAKRQQIARERNQPTSKVRVFVWVA
jgi:hypothetical protein